MQALGPIGAGTAIAGKLIQGKAYSDAGKYNQRVAERNALYAERDASAAAADAREQSRKAIGAQLVAQGGSGFQMGSGSALDALIESQVNGMLDAMTIRREGASRASAYRSQGALARMEGQARAMGEYFGAAEAAFRAAGDYAAAGG